MKGSIEHSDERYENHKQNDEDESEDDDGDSSCSVEDTYHRNGAKDVEDTSSSLMNGKTCNGKLMYYKSFDIVFTQSLQ